ncbi:MAG: hypothetical protein RI912_863 [Actinomycetota bacterium]
MPKTTYPRSMSTITADVMTHAAAHESAIDNVHGGITRAPTVIACAAPTETPVLTPYATSDTESWAAPVIAVPTAAPTINPMEVAGIHHTVSAGRAAHH